MHTHTSVTYIQFYKNSGTFLQKYGNIPYDETLKVKPFLVSVIAYHCVFVLYEDYFNKS